jgi:GT2 family glycosyltransferase
MNPKIIILLPVHNRREITRKFLECLNEQTYKNWHLILVDDGCADGTAEMAKKTIDNITILKGNGNLWWAGSLQLAYNYLKTSVDFKDDDIVLIINDDVLLGKEFFEDAVKTFDENKSKKILLSSIAVNHLNGDICPAGIYFDSKKFTFTSTDETEKTNCFSTRGLFLRFIDFKNSSGFYPKLLPHYLSDYEFTYRLMKKKKTIPVLSKELTLKFFPENSGFDTPINENKIGKYFKALFSKKNKSNPIHWIVFIFLTTQFPYNFKNVFRIIYLNAKQIAVVLKRSVTR